MDNKRQTIASLIICFIAAGSFGMHYAKHPNQITTLEDRDGNVYTLKVMPDKKQWMTANLNINIPGSYCYEDTELNCDKYGRLYTWESAQKGCAVLGEGWRLPADEEWKQMAEQYGQIPVAGSRGEKYKAAYKALLHGGSAGFNALLGGGRDPDGNYARLEHHGFYWTATESDIGMAVFYNFGSGAGMLFHQNEGEKSWALSVRCVRDVEALK